MILFFVLKKKIKQTTKLKLGFECYKTTTKIEQQKARLSHIQPHTILY